MRHRPLVEAPPRGPPAPFLLSNRSVTPGAQSRSVLWPARQRAADRRAQPIGAVNAPRSDGPDPQTEKSLERGTRRTGVSARRKEDRGELVSCPSFGRSRGGRKEKKSWMRVMLNGNMAVNILPVVSVDDALFFVMRARQKVAFGLVCSSGEVIGFAGGASKIQRCSGELLRVTSVVLQMSASSPGSFALLCARARTRRRAIIYKWRLVDCRTCMSDMKINWPVNSYQDYYYSSQFVDVNCVGFFFSYARTRSSSSSSFSV